MHNCEYFLIFAHLFFFLKRRAKWLLIGECGTLPLVHSYLWGRERLPPISMVWKLRYREGEHLHVLNATSFLTEVSFCFPSLFPLLSASPYLEVRIDLSMTLTDLVGISLTGLLRMSKEMKERLCKLSAPCLHRGPSQWTSGLVYPHGVDLGAWVRWSSKGGQFQQPC